MLTADGHLVLDPPPSSRIISAAFTEELICPTSPIDDQVVLNVNPLVEPEELHCQPLLASDTDSYPPSLSPKHRKRTPHRVHSALATYGFESSPGRFGSEFSRTQSPTTPRCRREAAASSSDRSEAHPRDEIMHEEDLPADFKRQIVHSDPGIALCPVVLRPPTKYLFFVFLMFIGGIWSVVNFMQRLVIDETIPLPPHANLDVHARICDIYFLPATDTSKVVMRGWMHQMTWFSYPLSFFTKTAPVSATDEASNTIMITLHRRYLSFWFRCSVSIYLEQAYQFQSLSIDYDLSDEFCLVKASVPINSLTRVSARFRNAEAVFQAVNAPLIDVVIDDGLLDIGLMAPEESLEFRLTSRSAVLVVRTDGEMKMQLPENDVIRTMIQSDGMLSVSLDDDVALVHVRPNLKSRWSSIGVINSKPDTNESPLYIVCGHELFSEDFDRQTVFDTWAGRIQAQPPHLSEVSLARVAELPAWIAQADDSIWAVLVDMVGPYMPLGRWKFVSTPALLGHNIDTILLAGGSLDPRVLAMKLHIYGLYCPALPQEQELMTTLGHRGREVKSARRLEAVEECPVDAPLRQLFHWAQSDASLGGSMGQSLIDHSECISPILETQFRVLWRTLQEIRAPSITPVWADGSAFASRDIVYALFNDAILTQVVTYKQTWRFSLAIALNAVISLVIAAWAVMRLKSEVHETTYNGYLFEESITNSASWRLDNSVCKPPRQDWHINVSVYLSQTSSSGFVVRWIMNQNDFSQFAYLIAVVRDCDAKSSDKLKIAWASLRDDEVVLFFPIKQVMSVMTLSGPQKEIRIPAVNRSAWRRKSTKFVTKFEATQQWRLRTDRRYRVKLFGCDKNQRLVSRSSWSNPVVLHKSMSLADWPFLLYGMFNRTRTNSLHYFVHKFCRPLTALDISVELKKIRLIMVQVGDPQKITYRIQLFSVDPHLLSRHTLQHRREGQTSAVEATGIAHRSTIRRNMSKYQSPHVVTAQGVLDVPGVLNLKIEPISCPRFYLTVQDSSTQEWLAASNGTCEDVLRHLVRAATYGSREAHMSFPLYDSKGEVWGKMQTVIPVAPVLPYMEPRNASHEKVPRRPYFADDLATSILYQGCDFTIRWNWTSSSSSHDNVPSPHGDYPPGPDSLDSSASEVPTHIFLHVVCAITRRYICSLRLGGHIPNTRSFVWLVDLPFNNCSYERYKLVSFIMTDVPYTREQPVPVLALSNKFFVMRTLTICEFEYSYAAFCGSNRLEMQHISKETLQALNLRVEDKTIRIVENLRRPLPFEDLTQDVIHCPGQCIISANSRLISLRTNDAVANRTSEGTNSAGLESLLRIYRAPGASSSSHDDEIDDSAGLERVDVYKSISARLPVICNISIDADPYFWRDSKDANYLSHSLMPVYPWAVCQFGLWKYLWRPKLQDSDYIIHTKSYEQFHYERWVTYSLLPHLLSFFDIMRVPLAAAAALGIMGSLALHNYLMLDFIRGRTSEPDPRIAADIVFALDRWSFFWRMPRPFPLVYFLLGVAGASTVLYSFMSPYVRSWLSYPVDPCRRILTAVWVTAFWYSNWMLFMSANWLIIAGLVNFAASAPTGVMLVSVGFVAYSINSSFNSARETIHNFIGNNFNKLLGVSLDSWFDHHPEVQFHAKEDDNLSIDFLGEALRKKRALERRQYAAYQQVVREKKLGDLVPRKRRSTEAATQTPIVRQHDALGDLTSWRVQAIVAPGDSLFTVDRFGAVGGLDGEIQNGGRLLTLNEAISHGDKCGSLLDPGENALVLGGSVTKGPNGLNFSRWHLHDDQLKFSLALLAYVKYPPASSLSMMEKVQMIFRTFDANNDDLWSLDEYENWLRILESNNNYTELLNFEIAENEGCRCADLYHVYLHMGDQINVDYAKIFHTNIQDEFDGFSIREKHTNVIDDAPSDNLSDGIGSLDLSEEAMGVYESESEERDSELPSTTLSSRQSDVSSSSSPDTSDSDKGGWASEPESDVDIEEHVKTDFNARKLLVIFKKTAAQGESKALQKLIQDRELLAEKVYETQQRLLVPLFGFDSVMSGNLNRTSSATSLTSFERPARQNGIIDHLICVQQQIANLITLELEQIHTKMTSLESLKYSVSQFYDETIIVKVQIKARAILKPFVELIKEELHPSNIIELKRFPPKTTFHLRKFLAEYRVTRDSDLQTLCALAPLVHGRERTIQLSVVTTILRDAGMLSSDDCDLQMQRNILRGLNLNVTTRNALESAGVMLEAFTGSLALLMPVTRACEDFISQVIEAELGTRPMTPDDAIRIVQRISETHLWSNSFVLLVRLLGITLHAEALPGVQLFDNDLNTDSPLGHSPHLQEVFLQRRLEHLNMIKIRGVFRQLSSDCGFLPVDLADEAIHLLTENQMNLAAAIVCLQELGLNTPFHGEDVQDVLRHLGVVSGASMQILRMKTSTEYSTDLLDWTNYYQDCDEHVNAEFNKLTSGGCLFLSKSQMIELARSVCDYLAPRSVPKTARSRPSRDQMSSDEPSNSHDAKFVTFRMLHETLRKMRLSVSHSHSLLLWTVLSSQSADELLPTLSLPSVGSELMKIILQPRNSLGAPWTEEEGIVEFTGGLTFVMFLKLMNIIGITISMKGAKTIWAVLPKGGIDLSKYILTRREKDVKIILTVDADSTALDPYQGKLVPIFQITRRLPRLLQSGLWPEAISSLLSLNAEVVATPTDLQNAVEACPPELFNKFGLLKPRALTAIFQALRGEGMAFAALEKMILAMNVRMPRSSIRRMFSLMDTNHDMSLDIKELMSGFRILFSHFVPVLVIDGLGCSTGRQLIVLVSTISYCVVFFIFVGLTFRSFSASSGSTGSILQSLLALGGAISLQSGAQKDPKAVERELRQKMAALLGENFEAMFANQEVQQRQLELEGQKTEPDKVEGRPVQLRYLFIKNVNWAVRDQLSFRPGDKIRLEPVVLGKVDIIKLRWSITPALPVAFGLVFCHENGVITGRIPEIATTVPEEEDISTYFWKRWSFRVTCRSTAGTVSTRLTFRILPHQLPSYAAV